jgi:hypothetical protein
VLSHVSNGRKESDGSGDMPALRQAHQHIGLAGTTPAVGRCALWVACSEIRSIAAAREIDIAGGDARHSAGTHPGAAATLSSKPALALTLAGLASLGLPAPPSFAQQIPRQPPTTVAPQQPLRSPATIKCPNGDRYKLSTGTTEGLCKVYVDLGTIRGGLCTDGTNSALQSCTSGCGELRGTGSCEKLDPSAADNAT